MKKYSVLPIRGETDLNIINITEGEFVGCQFTLGAVKFADEPNDDGTYSVSFDYNITNDYYIKDDRKDAFLETLGEILSSILEEAIQNAETVFKGGK